MSEKKSSRAAGGPPVPATLPLPLWRGLCNAWECDTMGHMNVRFYMERAHQGWAPLAAAMKLPGAFHHEATSTLVPREAHIRFHREIRPGEGLDMRGGVLSVEDETLVFYQELVKTQENAVAATYRVVLEHVEAKTGRPFAWPRKARDALSALMIDKIPEHAAPRSVDLNAPRETGSLDLALKLNVPQIGLSVIQADEVDSFGRMRPEFILGRQSDGTAHLVAAWRREAVAALTAEDGVEREAGGAALECRLSFRRWPKAGDLVQVHGGIVNVAAKTMRFVFWIVDPVSGECWWESETAVAHFDVKARRAFEAPPEMRAILEGRVIKGLML
jgi:acyl-CoA thioester hydrolase